MRYLLLFILSITILMGAEAKNNALTDKEIVMVEKGVLSEAIESKDYETISTMAYSFYSTSLNPAYTGDRKALEKRAISLYEICHNGNYISSSLFLVKTFLKENPAYSRKIAEESILKNMHNDNMRGKTFYNNLVMLYVSSILDDKRKSKEKVNFALEALQSLPLENAKTKFYSAFLFNALGMDDIANEYLNDACHSAKQNSSIYKYCLNGKEIEKEDKLQKIVENSGCKKDIGKRCK